jgi:NAD(P)-dependent dehydrogenase (short-subunit alcohol dehydrogenase family)
MAIPELPDDPFQAFDLSGRVAVVTGAAQGVGRACAEILAYAGALVVCTDRNPSDGTVDIIRGRGGRAEGVLLDVTDAAAVEAAFADLARRLGSLDILVNNAGTQLASDAVYLREEDLDVLLAVNLKSAILCSQAAGRIMLSQGSGSIVNIASEAIDRPTLQTIAYSATKAGVRQLARNLSAEWASRGVRVNVVAPGFMDTPLTRSQSPGEEFAQRSAAVATHYPLGRIGRPADVAYAVLYLASDASSWMTGQALRPNGGGAMPW